MRYILGVWLICAIAAVARGEIRGTWSDGDPQRTLKNVHLLGAATLLKNGKVLAAGGLDRGSLTLSATAVAELYDPVERRWMPTGSLKTPRWSLDAVTLRNGKALFAGGASAFRTSAALASAEIYDPETGEFAATPNDLSAARQAFGISELRDGRVILVGGNPTGNNLNGSGVTAVDIFDPETNTFTAAAPLHSGRALHAQLTLKDGRVLVIGGAQKTAEIYDPGRNTWTVAEGQLPTTLKDMQAFELFDGRVLILGGQNSEDGVTTDDTWFFDVARGEFQPGPSMAGFHYAPTGVQVGCSDYSAFDLFPKDHPRHGRFLLIAGGEHDPLEGPDVELHSAAIFDVARGRFVNIGPMPYVHDDHTESRLDINDKGNPEFLLFGGNTSQGTSRLEVEGLEE